MISSLRSPGDTVVSAISRNATTGFLSLSRSTVIFDPDEIKRARWLATRTSSKRFSTLSTQSSTVTRAIGSLLHSRNLSRVVLNVLPSRLFQLVEHLGAGLRDIVVG